MATPTLTTTGLADSMRRWRVTSAATANATADERSAGWVCWRGNAAGLGGWNYVNRLSLTTVQATGMGFFGLYGSISALATTLPFLLNSPATPCGRDERDALRVRCHSSDLPGMQRWLAGRTERQLWEVPWMRSLSDLCRKSEDFKRRTADR